MSTLYEQIGGEEAVNAAVDLFYQKVLADERVNHFFEGVDMERQAQHQKRFLSYAFGGLPHYPGRSLRMAHQRLVAEKGLNDEHFDVIAELLTQTLEELKIAPELIQQVQTIVESTRNEVLNR